MTDRQLDDGPELPVFLFAKTHIAGVDAIFVERLRAIGMIGEQLVPDIVKISHQRRGDAHFQEPLFNVRHGERGLGAVNRDTHDLRACACEVRHLTHGPLNVGGVGVGHGLHHDGRASTHKNGASARPHANADGDRPSGGSG